MTNIFPRLPNKIPLTYRKWIERSGFLPSYTSKEKIIFNEDFGHKMILCRTCSGSGKIHLEEDRDPYEGHKLSPLYTCTSCGGSQYVHWDRYKSEFKAAVGTYKKTVENYQNDRRIALQIAKKLTEQQKTYLKKRGVDFIDYGKI